MLQAVRGVASKTRRPFLEVLLVVLANLPALIGAFNNPAKLIELILGLLSRPAPADDVRHSE